MKLGPKSSRASICAVNFSNNISKSASTWKVKWNDLWNFLLTTKLKDKYFHNYIDGSGLFLQVHVPSELKNISRFTVSRLLEMHLWAFSAYWHDLIISPLWFLQRQENLIWDGIAFFFPTAFWKIRG